MVEIAPVIKMLVLNLRVGESRIALFAENQAVKLG